MVYVGVSARFHVNIEALNMAESVGNVVRHKKAPVVVRVPGKDEYVLRYVPVISGQSIAHGYQAILADVAARMSLPVCPLCREGVFVKHGSDEILKRLANVYGASYAKDLLDLAKKAKSLKEKFFEQFEEKVISNCVVEDVGGFLYPGGTPVKRTSRFYSGYMMPALQHIHSVGVEAQMHVRHDPRSVAGRAGEETGQAIYYVETGSALYTVNMALDLDGIGCINTTRGLRELGDAGKRREAALRALALLVEGMLWGAKKTRFLPSASLESIVVAVSHPYPFNPEPGHYDDYIVKTVARAKSFLDAAKAVAGDAFLEIYYYVSDKAAAKKPEEGAMEKASAAEAILEAAKHLGKAKCG